MRHYGNRYWQERLDRFLAKDLLSYARLGTAPPVARLERQSWQLRPLQRFLEVEGWQSEENATVAGVRVPLAIRSAENTDTLAVGTYPALLDRDAEAFRHPLHALDGEDDVRLIFLNDFVVSRDLRPRVPKASGAGTLGRRRTMKPLYQIRKPTSGARPSAYYSHTGLTQIESCPRRWWLLHSKYDKLGGPYPEPVSSGAMRGSIVHAALERFPVEWSRSGMTKEPGGIKAFRRQFPIREIVREARRRLLENARANPRAQMVMLEANVSVDSCISLFKDLVRLSYGDPALERGAAAQSSEDRSEERLVGAPTELIGERAGKVVPCPAVLPEVTLKVENPRVHGKIDLVETAEEGDSLVEYKTGEPRPEHEKQSRLYAFLWWAVTGRVVRERQLLYPNQNAVKLGAMTQAELEEEGAQLRARIVWANGEVESALPSVRLDADRCRSCTVRQLCEEYWTARETAASRWTQDDAGRPRPSTGNPEWRDFEIELLQTEQLAEGFVVRGRPKGGAQIVCKIPPQFRVTSADSFKTVRFLNVGLVADGEGARLVWSSASEAFWS